jgi:uncharacterized protein YkwD
MKDRSPITMALNRLLPLILIALAIPTWLPAQTPGPDSATDPQSDQPIASTRALRNMAQQLFEMGNQARAAQGLPALQWDTALAAAALKHCARMAAEGPISHQYNGELDLSRRAGQAGAHFNLIEENVAVGPTPAAIHQSWMNSPGHRDNLLNPEVNRAGVAVVPGGNLLYAVVDFSRAVSALTGDQVESTVVALLQAKGIAAHGRSAGARQACAQESGMPAALDGRRPEFIMRWQDSSLDRLPDALLARIASGRYHDAVVASCTEESADKTFTVYRMAVLLLRP